MDRKVGVMALNYVLVTFGKPFSNGPCLYSFQYGVNLHVLLMFFTLINNSGKQQKLRDPSGGPLRCLN